MAIEGSRLNDEFTDEAEAAAALVVEWPDAAPPPGGRLRQPAIRTWHLGKFPDNLIYVVRTGEIFVLAYAHEARRPGYWSHRLEH